MVYGLNDVLTVFFFFTMKNPSAKIMAAVAAIVPSGISGMVLNEVALMLMTFLSPALSFPVESWKNA